MYDQHAERNMNRVISPAISIKPYFVRVPLIRRYTTVKRKRVCVGKQVFFRSIPLLLPWEIQLFLVRVGRFREVPSLAYGSYEFVFSFGFAICQNQ